MGIGRTEEDWVAWRELGEDWTPYVPLQPQVYYAKTGDWISWEHFLTGDGDAFLEPQQHAQEILPPNYFVTVDYGQFVPWDLGGSPQPVVRRAFQTTAPSRILDVGCGAGDNANWLAARGHRVLGVDLNPGAVSAALDRRDHLFAEHIRKSGGSADFRVDNVLEMTHAVEFDIALDSGLLHCLSDAHQSQYLARLARAVQIGGRLYVGCFSDMNPSPWSNPRRLSKVHLENLFDDANWRLLDIDRIWWQRPVPPQDAEERITRNTAGWCLAWWCVVERRGAF